MVADKPPGQASLLLSICIPTYNRSACLANCLESLDRATKGCRNEIEVIVSDNASTDHTADVVAAYKDRLPLRSIRNATNIGGERNFFSAAGHAAAEHVWVFGDDDEFGEDSVTVFLASIKAKNDLILCNFSAWSKDMSRVTFSEVLTRTYKTRIDDPEEILSTFGILLGYISCIVVRKNILLSTPSSEYERFVEYGFPFPYCIYRGLYAGVRMAYLSTPLFKRRDDNSIFDGPGAHTKWIKYFVEGPALVFEALRGKGYSPEAVWRAKSRNLQDFGIGNILPGIASIDRAAVRSMMVRHYWRSWRFWAIWFPVLTVPSGLVRGAHGIYRWARGQARSARGASGVANVSTR